MSKPNADYKVFHRLPIVTSVTKVAMVIMAAVLFVTAGGVATTQAKAPSIVQVSGTFSIGYEGYNSIPLLVGLNDASGYFMGDPIYLLPKDQQIVSKAAGTASNGKYSLTLPAKPAGRPFDVTGNKAQNANLMIFDVRVMSDVASRGYMVTNEDSVASSLRVAIDFTVKGGKMLVWAGGDAEPFPSGVGLDAKLFTADDPRITLSSGWSLVDLDKKPFEIVREDMPQLNLITTDSGDVNDYSALSCAELIPTFLDRVQSTYPFTDLHKIDWAALRSKLIPASKTAKTNADCQMIFRDFGNAIPDGHVNFGLPALSDDSGGALGIRLEAINDGSVVVSYIRPKSPADEAGIKVGAIITQWGGKSLDEALKSVVLQSANSSTPDGLLAIKLGQLPFGKLGTKVSVSFRNPGAKAVTKTLTRVPPQRAQFPAKDKPQVTDNKLPSGVGYVRINSFLRGGTLAAFDKTIDGLIRDDVPGIIIDVRSNPGGLSQMSDAMASRFFHKSMVIGKEFSQDGRLVYMMQLEPRGTIYHGPVAILVDRNTASAADLFAYTFKSTGRGVIVGQTPSAGMAGTVSGGQYKLPGGAFIQVPTGGFFDANDKTAVEGEGVAPDVKVPTTVETLLSSKDFVLDAAVASFKAQVAK